MQKWENSGTFVPKKDGNGRKFFYVKDLLHVPEIREMVDSSWEQEMEVLPLRPYTSIELFAGAGGLALGMEKAGFSHVLLNEIDHDACATLQYNRPEWRVAEQDVRQISFKQFEGKVDFLSGGFPCQAFSYAGKQGGFNDTRGTLFFELAELYRNKPKAHGRKCKFAAQWWEDLINKKCGKRVRIYWWNQGFYGKSSSEFRNKGNVSF